MQEYTAQDFADAREDLTEKFLAGDRIGRIDLEALLDQELNDNYAATLRSLYEHFANIGNCDDTDVCSGAHDWMTRLVKAYLNRNPDLIEERAAEIAAERLEDAS